DAAVGRFCSSLALLLASIKIEDDIRDDHSTIARVARWILKRRFRRASQFFSGLDFAFAERVSQLVSAHHLLEQTGTAIPLSEYVHPTAEAFSYVFGLMAHVPGLTDYKQPLMRVGREIGAAIIAADCAADWPSDRRQGRFNPLPNEESRASAWLS